LCPGKSD